VRLVAAIGFGSAIGGIARFLLGSAIQHRAGADFPLGTFIINVTGSLLVGFLLRYALGTPAISTELRAMLTTGFCGGYTTFSTFSYETAVLVEDGDHLRAALYVASSVVVGLLATFLGFAAAHALLGFQERV
jgi:fluoride exporter